jgi:hypothetical protein
MSDQNADESPGRSDEPGKDEPRDGGGVGGDLLIGVVLMVIGAVCIKDGFIKPPADWERWKIIFNQVITVVGLLGGLAMIIRGLLRPRTTPPKDDPGADDKQ